MWVSVVLKQAVELLDRCTFFKILKVNLTFDMQNNESLIRIFI